MQFNFFQLYFIETSNEEDNVNDGLVWSPAAEVLPILSEIEIPKNWRSFDINGYKVHHIQISEIKLTALEPSLNVAPTDIIPAKYEGKS